MMTFPVTALWDEQKCCEFLQKLLHPQGLACPRCAVSVGEARVHRYDRAPILQYQCRCGRIYNLFTGTVWQGTHHSCAIIIEILRGIAQGKPTLKLAEELGVDRKHLLERRHQLQAHVAASAPSAPLPDAAVECDEMYQNAGEKRSAPPRSCRSPAAARQ